LHPLLVFSGNAILESDEAFRTTHSYEVEAEESNGTSLTAGTRFTKRACLFVGVRESIPRAENGRLGAACVRPGGGGVQVPAGHSEQPVLCDIGRERSRQDRDHQVHPAVPVFGHQQRRHVGGAADPGGQYHPRGIR